MMARWSFLSRALSIVLCPAASTVIATIVCSQLASGQKAMQPGTHPELVIVDTDIGDLRHTHCSLRFKSVANQISSHRQRLTPADRQRADQSNRAASNNGFGKRHIQLHRQLRRGW